MPYITPERKKELFEAEGVFPSTAGELNFILTMLCIEFIQRGPQNYQAYNDVVGALEGCKMEFYRRALAPYEDIKIGLNGDVYT